MVTPPGYRLRNLLLICYANSMPKAEKPSPKKALPGGAKKGVSFTKRSGGEQSMKAQRSLSGDEGYGPRKSGNIGASVGDDGSGTRFTAGLPPQTMAMAAPAAEIPDTAKEIAADVLPVPSAEQCQDYSIVGWDYMRDVKLGKTSKR